MSRKAVVENVQREANGGCPRSNVLLDDSSLLRKQCIGGIDPVIEGVGVSMLQLCTFALIRPISCLCRS